MDRSPNGGPNRVVSVRTVRRVPAEVPPTEPHPEVHSQLCLTKRIPNPIQKCIQRCLTEVHPEVHPELPPKVHLEVHPEVHPKGPSATTEVRDLASFIDEPLPAACDEHYLHLELAKNDPHRLERLRGIDQICQEKLGAGVNWPTVMLSRLEFSVLTLRCVAFSGMPRADGIAGFEVGRGLLQLSVLEGETGRHRLHFVLEDTIQSFQGMEIWNKDTTKN